MTDQQSDHPDSERTHAHDTFRHLVENSPFGVYAVDADFRLVQVSAGAQKVFRNVRPLIGRDFAEVLRIIWEEPFATEAIDRFRHTLSTGEPYRSAATTERRHDVPETESYDWKIERVMMPDGRFGVVCHFYDLSERQRYEEALREADRRKNEFLAVLSHELRNPLAPIRTGIYLLERAAPDSEQAARARATIRRQTDHLTKLVDDLLDVTRISSGKIELKRERFDLREVVRRTTDDMHAMYEQAGIELRVELEETEIWIDADRTRMAQVLGNLLQNSLKFTPSGGAVTVTVASAGGRAELTVGDTGYGIEPGELQRMFEPFAQAAQPLARTAGGLGLGLSLVKGLVELHGGSVGAHSAGLGRGTTIAVSLPLGTAPAVPSDEDRPAALNERRVVLIIEDNADLAAILTDLLALHGHQVHAAPDGVSGLALARELRPDVVVCDIGLPDLDGYQVAREIRQDHDMGRARLIALSGYAQADDRLRSRESGFDAHLAKPPHPDDLVKAVNGLG